MIFCRIDESLKFKFHKVDQEHQAASATSYVIHSCLNSTRQIRNRVLFLSMKALQALFKFHKVDQEPISLLGPRISKRSLNSTRQIRNKIEKDKIKPAPICLNSTRQIRNYEKQYGMIWEQQFKFHKVDQEPIKDIIKDISRYRLNSTRQIRNIHLLEIPQNVWNKFKFHKVDQEPLEWHFQRHCQYKFKFHKVDQELYQCKSERLVGRV